jgi:hypothetical protein
MFPKPDREQELLAEYHRQDTVGSSTGSDPGDGSTLTTAE